MQELRTHGPSLCQRVSVPFRSWRCLDHRSPVRIAAWWLVASFTVLSAANANPHPREWYKGYNGPVGGSDVAAAIAVAHDGTVYVSGYSMGDTGNDYATVKYSPAGAGLVVATYDGLSESGNDSAVDIVLDNDGNVYVTGRSRGDGTGDDYATVKYDADLNQLWEARYDGLASADDHPSGLALDDDGNVYVSGTSWDEPHYQGDYATVKYNADGVEQWVARYNNPTGIWEIQSGRPVVDDDGNVYVTGSSHDGGAGAIFDYVTIKYAPNGVEQWVARYNGPVDGSDLATGIALDPAGNVYVTGASRGADSLDYVTIKYSAAGDEQWVARYDSEGGGDDKPRVIAVDEIGNVYVAGRPDVVKYDSNGNEQWVSRFERNGGIGGDGTPRAITIGPAGHAYVTGYWGGAGGFLTVEYGMDGAVRWSATSSFRLTNGAANDLAVDAAGRIYVTGWTYEGNQSNNFATIKYSGDCNANDIGDLCDINCEALEGACNVSDCGNSLDNNANDIPDECENAVPTISEWGLIVLTTLLTTAGTILLRSRRAVGSA